jgi:hypothetical protein
VLLCLSLVGFMPQPSLLANTTGLTGHIQARRMPLLHSVAAAIAIHTAGRRVTCSYFLSIGTAHSTAQASSCSRKLGA